MNTHRTAHYIEIIDRPASIPAGRLKSLGSEILDHLKRPPSRITLAFVDDEKMRELNSQFRNKDSTTDVLSFPIDEVGHDQRNYLGDIAISTQQAKKQAREFNHPYMTEVLQLFTHGILHLCGYDHAADSGEMDETELRLRSGIVDRYCS